MEFSYPKLKPSLERKAMRPLGSWKRRFVSGLLFEDTENGINIDPFFANGC